ncbi:hypothetical protein MSG28_014842 [Choristoneura fumiferana]|uniref:Uncharacterized protein n=1 Tax=Choristoneura fumiferana TaxID=7141 RepID=A0ACC0JT64_CHOFU|nr:hypothetical protein MSG28_014842 [Choristoneura fumiferana]
MESSDAEQSVRWTCSVTVKCEPVTVKEEPQGGECGVSEAAVAGLYAGHEVKDEIVIGPETVQQQDVAFSMQSALNSIEQYPSKLQRAGGASLHSRPGEESRCDMSHKQQFQLRSCSVRLERILMEDLPTYTLNRTEVVPCQLQPAGGAGAAPECTHTRPGEGPRCNMSHDQQFQLRSCSVRLERMPMEDLPRCDTCLHRAGWLVRVVVMESAACRRRASDAEQSAWWTYSATAECEPVAVKEEPEGGECGVSEAAVAECLFAGHEVKDELIPCGDWGWVRAGRSRKAAPTPHPTAPTPAPGMALAATGAPSSSTGSVAVLSDWSDFQ